MIVNKQKVHDASTMINSIKVLLNTDQGRDWNSEHISSDRLHDAVEVFPKRNK